MEVDVAKGRQCVEAILKSDVGITPKNAEGQFLRYIVNEVAFQKRTEGIVVFPLPKETLDKLGYKELAAALRPPAKPANAADAMEAAPAWVRETASRLRQGLEDYYAKGNGKADPYQIMLPRRGYVPEFAPRIPWIKWIVVAVLVVVVLAGGIVWFRVRSTGLPPPPPAFTS